MKTTFVRNGLLLGTLCIIIFLITRYGFYEDFFTISAMVNIAVFPTIYVLFATFSTWKLSKQTNEISFRSAFSSAYIRKWWEELLL